MRERLGKLAYGGLFVLGWPLSLALWSGAIDASGFATWPVPGPPWAGGLLVVAGTGLIGTAMLLLFRHGEGLPMNAYPTRRLVTSALYGWIAHPIYVGFTLCVLGAALLAGSPAAFWFGAPLSGLAAAALVLGYEGPALRARLGARGQPPRLGLPDADDQAVPLWRRIWLCLATLGAWAGLYAIVSTMPAPSGARSLALPIDHLWPRPAIAVWVYSLAYPYAIAGPLCLRTGADLRRFFVAAWIVIAAGFGAMILLPGSHPLPVASHGGLTDRLTGLNHGLDAPWLAFPSFHVAWTAIASACLARRWPGLRRASIGTTVLVALSCLTTGAHALVDVLGGWALGIAAWRHAPIWAGLVGAAERLSNSLAGLRIGPVRILSHAVWSWSAAFVGMLTVLVLAGPGEAGRAFALFCVATVAAGIWGHRVEAATRLSRPFGYFGFLLSAAVCLLVLWSVDAGRASALAAACAVAAPLAQAIGRMRCLVQGCCHGRPVARAAGIRVRHPLSRVTRLAGFACTAIHPTPLYSALANLIVFAILLRLWQVEAPAALIVSAYLVLTTLARFTEEQFRGEPQTPGHGGLNAYQWIAVATLPFGMAAIALPGGPVPEAAGLSLAAIGVAAAAGTVAALAMSVDLPGSGLPFSELSAASEDAGPVRP